MDGELPTLSTWAAISIVAGVTLASRLAGSFLAGSFLMGRADASPGVERFLDGLSVAVIAALVASSLAQNSLREGVAVAVTVLVMLRSATATRAMIAGMALAAAWANFPAM